MILFTSIHQPALFLFCSYLNVAVPAGQVKRRGALVGAGVDVGSVADQQGEQRRVAVQGGGVERREAVNVRAVNAESSGLQDGQLQDRGSDTGTCPVSAKPIKPAKINLSHVSRICTVNKLKYSQ